MGKLQDRWNAQVMCNSPNASSCQMTSRGRVVPSRRAGRSDIHATRTRTSPHPGGSRTPIPLPGLLEAIAFRLEAIASSLEKTYTKWSLRVDSTCTARTARGPRGPCAALCAAPPLTPCAAVSHAFAVAVCTALCHSSRACGGCCE